MKRTTPIDTQQDDFSPAENPLKSDEFRSRAEAYCARAEHCAEEVRTKLYTWSCPAEYIDSIIAHLYDSHFLDDARYCHAFAHDKLLYQQWGKIKIRAHLQAHRLPSSAIQEALNSIDETEYNRILRSLISQKSRSLRSSSRPASYSSSRGASNSFSRTTPEPTDYNSHISTSPDSCRSAQDPQRDRLIRFLMQRGFSYSDILSVLSSE